MFVLQRVAVCTLRMYTCVKVPHTYHSILATAAAATAALFSFGFFSRLFCRTRTRIDVMRIYIRVECQSAADLSVSVPHT